MSVSFSALKKEINAELKGIGVKSTQEWEIFLPGKKVDQQVIDKIIKICRNHMIIDWHIYFGEETEECPNPEVRITWDRKETA